MPGDALKKFDWIYDWKLYIEQTRAKKSREFLGERYVDPWSFAGFTATDSNHIIPFHSTSRKIIQNYGVELARK